MNVFRINSIKRTSGCLIFLHGSGGTGKGVGETVNALRGKSAQFAHVKILFPTAPLIPYTPLGGEVLNTWCDISDFSENAIENKDQLKKSASQIVKLIEKEVSSGLPINRIAIAGFSRGGAMSYYIGYSYLTGLAGVGVLSSWLPKTSCIYEKLGKSEHLENFPPLSQSHGDEDIIVRPALGEKTSSFFKSVGIQTEFKIYPSVSHEISPPALDDLYAFVQRVIPKI